jgi:HJR/Mrr/RecB family endonuclease
MDELQLSDLYSPNEINAILTTNNGYIKACKDQGFQEYPNCIELWQKMEDGRLLRVHRWTSKTLIATY